MVSTKSWLKPAECRAAVLSPDPTPSPELADKAAFLIDIYDEEPLGRYCDVPEPVLMAVVVFAPRAVGLAAVAVLCLYYVVTIVVRRSAGTRLIAQSAGPASLEADTATDVRLASSAGVALALVGAVIVFVAAIPLSGQSVIFRVVAAVAFVWLTKRAITNLCAVSRADELTRQWSATEPWWDGWRTARMQLRSEIAAMYT